jgi:hypothetical protein
MLVDQDYSCGIFNFGPLHVLNDACKSMLVYATFLSWATMRLGPVGVGVEVTMHELLP